MKRSMRICLTVTFSVTCLWVASGCAIRQPAAPVVPPPAPSGQPTVEPAQPGQWLSDHYSDLPVPTGYDYKPDESFVFAQEGLRSADLRYVGDVKVENLIRYFEESMPSNGWKFLRLTGVRMKTLTFVKNREMCEIIIMSAQPQRIEDNEWQSSPRVSTHLHIKVNPY